MTAKKLIELSDGTLVEVEATSYQMERISGGLAEKVNATFDKIQPILNQVCAPVVNACKKLSTETSIEQAEIELGLSFEGEGNIYVTRSKASANLTIRVVIKPKEQPV